MLVKELIAKLQKLSGEATIEVRTFPEGAEGESIWFELVDVFAWPVDESFVLLETGMKTNY
jgi:hypothetical protein